MGAVTAAPRTAMLCAQLLLAAVPGMSAPVIGRASRGPQPRAEGLASASAYVPQGGPRAPLMMDADGNLYRPDGVKVPTDAGGMPIAGVGAFPLLSDLHRAQHGRGSRDDAAADDGRAAAPTSLVTAAPPAAAPPVVAPGPQPQATDTSQRSRRCSRYGAAKECNQGGCYWSDDSSTCYVRHVPGSDGTYAQNYQDWWVERVARHNHWDASGGYFLDIGAHSGLWCSNTKLLEERLGWNGVCVEPFPENGPTVGSFVNRTCLLVPRALTGTVDGKDVRMDGADAQSMSLKAADLVDVRSSSPQSSGRGKQTTTMSVAALLNSTRVPAFINFVSLDVEGLELDVLSAFPFASLKVGAWIVEHNNDMEKRAAVRALLEKHGYKAYDVENPGVDDYFMEPKFWHNSLKNKPWRTHPHGTFGC